MNRITPTHFVEFFITTLGNSSCNYMGYTKPFDPNKTRLLGEEPLFKTVAIAKIVYTDIPLEERIRKRTEINSSQYLLNSIKFGSFACKRRK